MMTDNIKDKRAEDLEAEAAAVIEEEEIRARRRALDNATDSNAAANMGGMGAQGGQADFGAAGNRADDI